MNDQSEAETTRDEPIEQPEAAVDPTPLEDAADSDDQSSAADLEAITQLALAGELEIPVGAETIVEAFIAAANARDDNFAKLQRAASDFHNFQRRAENNEREARQLGTSGVVQSIVPVLDHFELAMSLNPEVASAGQVLDGLKVIKDELLRVLTNLGVSTIEPEAGDKFNPLRHEAMMQQSAEGIKPGHVVACMQVGYTLNDRIIRPAQVMVAPSDEE